MRYSLFPTQGTWYKGNTHAHTTISDGKLTPAETTAWYRARGYSFVALTDHHIYGIHDHLNREDFLVLPGVEWGFDEAGSTGFCVHHLVGLGIPGQNRFAQGQRFVLPSGAPPQQYIDQLRANGQLVIYCHPHWSRTRVTSLLSLRGLLGIEIYNHVSHYSRSAYAEGYYDQLLWSGQRPYCFASDDAHGPGDCGGGWIEVKADELTPLSILGAIQAGHFYASTGPALHDVVREDDMLTVTCSPCRLISLQSDGYPTDAKRAADGPLTTAQFSLPPQATYVRVYCEDDQGHRAWSQPLGITKSFGSL